MFGGHRFYRQLTRGSGFPSYEVTDDYRDYVKSLPPDQAFEAVERVLKDMSARRRSYYRRHFPTIDEDEFEYPYSHFYQKKPYSFATHRPKYYN